MYERDKNHPCIIMWSLGNESGYGEVHDKMARWIRNKDSSRILMYEPASYGPRSDHSNSSYYSSLLNYNKLVSEMATDILCPMYARINDCITLANMYPDLPVIQCEYSHMMGNSGGNLVDYWQSYHRFPRLQGGFIWDWVDQGLQVGTVQGGSKWAYGGDFGEIFHDSNFCLNGLNWPDRGLGPILAQYHFNSGATENVFTKYNGGASNDDLFSRIVLCNHIYGLASKKPSDLLHEMDHVDLGTHLVRITHVTHSLTTIL